MEFIDARRLTGFNAVFDKIGSVLDVACTPEEADQLIPTALEMANHLLTLPPAARVNTVHMMRLMRPSVSEAHEDLAKELHDHGAKSDLMESRAAFAEKRAPNFKGWDDPEDRYRLPGLKSS